MIFHDIIHPERFRLGQKYKICNCSDVVTIANINADKIHVITTDGRHAAFHCNGFYYAHSFDGIVNPLMPHKELTIKNFILGKIPRLIPL